MVNEKLRKALEAYSKENELEEEEDILILDNHAYDLSIVGMTEDNRLIYDYNSMIEEFMIDEQCDYEEAQEWVDYNTMRAIPYMGDRAPIVLGRSLEEILEFEPESELVSE